MTESDGLSSTLATIEALAINRRHEDTFAALVAALARMKISTYTPEYQVSSACATLQLLASQGFTDRADVAATSVFAPALSEKSSHSLSGAKSMLSVIDLNQELPHITSDASVSGQVRRLALRVLLRLLSVTGSPPQNVKRSLLSDGLEGRRSLLVLFERDADEVVVRFSGLILAGKVFGSFTVGALMSGNLAKSIGKSIGSEKHVARRQSTIVSNESVLQDSLERFVVAVAAQCKGMLECQGAQYESRKYNRNTLCAIWPEFAEILVRNGKFLFSNPLKGADTSVILKSSVEFLKGAITRDATGTATKHVLLMSRSLNHILGGIRKTSLSNLREQWNGVLNVAETLVVECCELLATLESECSLPEPRTSCSITDSICQLGMMCEELRGCSNREPKVHLTTELVMTTVGQMFGRLSHEQVVSTGLVSSPGVLDWLVLRSGDLKGEWVESILRVMFDIPPEEVGKAVLPSIDRSTNSLDRLSNLQVLSLAKLLATKTETFSASQSVTMCKRLLAGLVANQSHREVDGRLLLACSEMIILVGKSDLHKTGAHVDEQEALVDAGPLISASLNFMFSTPTSEAGYKYALSAVRVRALRALVVRLASQHQDVNPDLLSEVCARVGRTAREVIALLDSEQKVDRKLLTDLDAAVKSVQSLTPLTDTRVRIDIEMLGAWRMKFP